MTDIYTNLDTGIQYLGADHAAASIPKGNALSLRAAMRDFRPYKGTRWRTEPYRWNGKYEFFGVVNMATHRTLIKRTASALHARFWWEPMASFFEWRQSSRREAKSEIEADFQAGIELRLCALHFPPPSRYPDSDVLPFRLYPKGKVTWEGETYSSINVLARKLDMPLADLYERLKA